MTQRQKLLQKLCDPLTDYTWDYFVSLMGQLGYKKAKSGRTGGSRRRYVHKSYAPISLHEPHPGNVLKKYQRDLVIEALSKEGIECEEQKSR